MNEREAAIRTNDKTLSERGNIYGPYQEGLDIRANILKAITDGYENRHGEPMPSVYMGYFWDIANKLCRLAVCPNHEDSWKDIVGYSKLIHNTVLESGDYK